MVFMSLKITGSSGSEYEFTVYSRSQQFNAVGGVYLFTKNIPGTNKHQYVYLGITNDLSTRFDKHHKEKEIKEAGATHICIFREDDKSKREKVERDLLSAINTICNDILN